MLIARRPIAQCISRTHFVFSRNIAIPGMIW